MGYYINPKQGTKEEWLAANATPISREEAAQFDFASDQLPICLVDNFAFTAAAIAYCPQERDVFLYDRTGRPRRWFSAPKAALVEWL